MHRSVHLRRVHPTTEAIKLVQAVIDAAPEYSMLTCGGPPAPDSAAAVFEALPPGRDYQDKFVFSVFCDGEDVGIVDLIRGYPSESRAMLGLLLISESRQGTGIGGEAYSLVEQVVRGWPEIRSIRIGVVETNSKVLPYWQRMGFVATGEVKPYVEGAVTSRVLALERALEGAA